jgi:hypothetical protein
VADLQGDAPGCILHHGEGEERERTNSSLHQKMLHPPLNILYTAQRHECAGQLPNTPGWKSDVSCAYRPRAERIRNATRWQRCANSIASFVVTSGIAMTNVAPSEHMSGAPYNAETIKCGIKYTRFILCMQYICLQQQHWRRNVSPRDVLSRPVEQRL